VCDVQRGAPVDAQTSRSSADLVVMALMELCSRIGMLECALSRS
jgi:hypothetical protein